MSTWATDADLEYADQRSIDFLASSSELARKYASLVERSLAALSTVDWVRETLASCAVQVLPWFTGNRPVKTYGVCGPAYDASAKMSLSAYLAGHWLTTLAHELRHVWQIQVAKRSWADDADLPYDERPCEKDAFATADLTVAEIDSEIVADLTAEAVELDNEFADLWRIREEQARRMRRRHALHQGETNWDPQQIIDKLLADIG